jgi:hypothetical protein
VADEQFVVLEMECATTSIVSSPSASMNVIASRAMASMVPGTVPLEDATPVLLNKMTSRSAAKASLSAGSWSSRVPMNLTAYLTARQASARCSHVTDTRPRPRSA